MDGLWTLMGVMMDGWMDGWKGHIILMKLDLKQIKGKGSFCFSKLELRMHQKKI